MLAVHGGWTGADLLHHLLALGLGGAALLLQRLAALGSLRCLQARGWIDAATGFHNLRGLLGEGDALLRQAQRADRPLGIVLLDFADLREARQVLGAAAADRIAGRLVRRIRRISGADGLIARTGAGQFVVLLPGQGQQGSVAALQRGLGRATTLECEAEVVLVPDVLVDVATRLECSIGHVFREMVQELYAQRGQEERRVRQVQRERERHLRPAGPAQPDAAALE
jgi:diguanylate cyclase (GGDEF)-like protein